MTCFQKQLKDKYLHEDIINWKLTHSEISRLKISDFEFRYVKASDKDTCQQIKTFIERYEWLGKLPNRPTHRFAYFFKGKIVAVIIMATPNAFSKILGEEGINLEKLISRGASISFAPKNTASSLIAKSIQWMTRETEFRVFSSYADTEADEIGTIYQACNFIYLGQNYGARHQYFDPKNPKKGWFSDREFRKVSAYKRYAERLGISWKADWSTRNKMLWENVPEVSQMRLKRSEKFEKNSCRKRAVPKKHKYIYIQGKDKRETNKLKRLFKKLNPALNLSYEQLGLPYPKRRPPTPVKIWTLQPCKNVADTKQEACL